MPRCRFTLTIAVTFLALLWGLAGRPATPPVHAAALLPAASTASSYYLALGDEITLGVQPNGDKTHGYAQILYAQLQRAHPHLVLVNMARKGRDRAIHARSR